MWRAHAWRVSTQAVGTSPDRSLGEGASALSLSHFCLAVCRGSALRWGERSAGGQRSSSAPGRFCTKRIERQDSLSAARGTHSVSMAAATHMLKTRVTQETKRIVESVACRQQITESAWLRRLITATLQSTGVTAETAPNLADETARASRLTIRLLEEDRLLLRSRAAARGMPTATYASVLIRSHLRAVAPVPREELEALKRSIGELGSIGRNLNQLARTANQGGRTTGPSREELRALLRACEGLRDHVRQLLQANVRSWSTGHDETPR